MNFFSGVFKSYVTIQNSHAPCQYLSPFRRYYISYAYFPLQFLRSFHGNIESCHERYFYFVNVLIHLHNSFLCTKHEMDKHDNQITFNQTSFLSFQINESYSYKQFLSHNNLYRNDASENSVENSHFNRNSDNII